MFDSKQEVEKLAKAMNIKINLKKVPKISVQELFLGIGDDIYETGGWLATVAKYDDGTFMPLAKVSEQYQVVQHHDALGQVLQTFKEDLPEFGINSCDIAMSMDGGSFWATFGSKTPITIKPGDDIFPQVVMTNSCDTSQRFHLKWGAVRQVCTNGMMGPDNRIEGGSTRRLHKKGSLSLEKEINNFKDSFIQASESLEIWKKYAEIEMDKNKIEIMMEDIKITEKQQEEIMQLPLRGDDTSINAELVKGNVDGWLAYNAVTQWITDTTKNKATEIERGIRATSVFDRMVA